MEALSKRDIGTLFGQLNEELGRRGVTGEVYLVGGAIMCLVFDLRESTENVDALFRPAKEVQEAARRVALDSGISPDWLNDAVKGYLGEHPDFRPYLDLPNLRIMTAAPEYLLAMKCLAMRIGEESRDAEDVRFLLRYLNFTESAAALEAVGRYYPLERVPQRTLYALEEMLADPDSRSGDPGNDPAEHDLS